MIYIVAAIIGAVLGCVFCVIKDPPLPNTDLTGQYVLYAVVGALLALWFANVFLVQHRQPSESDLQEWVDAPVPGEY